MKFLMENKCSITIKEAKGDTIREFILRYARNDSNLMINTYIKYEDKMVIEKIFEPLQNGFKWDKFSNNFKAFFKIEPRFRKSIPVGSTRSCCACLCGIIDFIQYHV